MSNYSTPRCLGYDDHLDRRDAVAVATLPGPGVEESDNGGNEKLGYQIRCVMGRVWLEALGYLTLLVAREDTRDPWSPTTTLLTSAGQHEANVCKHETEDRKC